MVPDYADIAEGNSLSCSGGGGGIAGLWGGRGANCMDVVLLNAYKAA
jgi:hypothetical protein